MNNLLKFKRDFKSYKSYFIHTLLPIVVYGCIIGLFTGAVVWAYTVAAEWLSEHTVEIYTFVRENPAFIPLLFLSLGALGFLAWLNVRSRLRLAEAASHTLKELCVGFSPCAG